MKKIMMLLTVCIISSQLIAQQTKTQENIPLPPLPPAKQINEVPSLPPLTLEAPEQVIPNFEKDKLAPPQPPPPPPPPPAPPSPPVKE